MTNTLPQPEGEKKWHDHVMKASVERIRAEVLPDDPEWHTGRMPTLIHTLPLTGPNARGLIFGMQTEARHVTI